MELSPARILAVGAHPSDVEFFAGATLAGFSSGLGGQAASVWVVVCTDGAKGAGGGALVSERRRECTDAAEKLGARDVLFLGYPEGRLKATPALVRDLVAQIRRCQPGLVLTHDPTNRWRRRGESVRLGHSDNRAAGQAMLDAIYPRAEQASYYPELTGRGLAPWLVQSLWLFDSAEPDHFPDTPATITLRQAKNAALACHVTQSPRRLIEEAEAEAEHYERLAGRPSEAFRRLDLL